jgi:uncharacterized protein (TIGR02271 family)
MANTEKTTDATIPLVEERLTVGKKRVETGRVRVHITTREETTEARSRLADQRVEVKRVPIGREVTELPVVRHEGDTMIIPVMEEVLVVEKRLVLIEEVHIRQLVTQTETAQPVTLRRQFVEVERIGAQPDDPVPKT